MTQEYEVLQFKKGDFQDQNGNYWCDLALRGEGEPVRIVVKDPTQFQDGMKLYGRITDETSKAGKPYKRFRREKRPDDQQSFTANTSNYKSTKYVDHHEAIKAQWAIGQAVQASGIKSTHELLPKDVEGLARALYAMVDRVQDSEHSQVVDEEAEKEKEYQENIAQAAKETFNLDEIPF